MAKKVLKRASAPMKYNNAIRVDDEPIKNSEALITSGAVAEAIDGSGVGWGQWIGTLDQYNAIQNKSSRTIYYIVSPT